MTILVAISSNVSVKFANADKARRIHCGTERTIAAGNAHHIRQLN